MNNYKQLYKIKIFYLFILSNSFKTFQFLIEKIENYVFTKEEKRELKFFKRKKFNIFFFNLNNKFYKNKVKKGILKKYDIIQNFLNTFKLKKKIFIKYFIFNLKKTQFLNAPQKFLIFSQNQKKLLYWLDKKKFYKFFLKRNFLFLRLLKRNIFYFLKKKKKFILQNENSKNYFFWSNKNFSKYNYILFYFWQINTTSFKEIPNFKPKQKVIRYFLLQNKIGYKRVIMQYNIILLTNVLVKQYARISDLKRKKNTFFHFITFKLQFKIMKPIVLNFFKKKKLNFIILKNKDKVFSFWNKLSLYFLKNNIKISNISWFFFLCFIPSFIFKQIKQLKISKKIINDLNNSNIITPYFFEKKKQEILLLKKTQQINQNYFLFFNILISNFLEFFFKKNIFFKLIKLNKFRKRFRKSLFFKQFFSRFRYYYILIGKGFFLKELLDVVWLTFLTKDCEFFLQWLSKTFEKIEIKKHKKILILLKKLFFKFFKKFKKLLKISGFFFDIRGKVGVIGNAKKRHISIFRGKNSFSEKKYKINHAQKIIRTNTGVLGVTFIIVFN